VTGYRKLIPNLYLEVNMAFLIPAVTVITSSSYFVPVSSVIAGGAILLGLKKANDLANDAKRYFLAFATTATTCCLTSKVKELNNCEPSSSDWACETMNVVNIGAIVLGTGYCMALSGKATWDAIRHHADSIERSSAASAQCIDKSMTSIGGGKKDS